MKNSIIASIVALGITGGAAHAADSTVIFQGAVSATTCDLTPSVGGAYLPDSTISLGTVAPNTEGQAVEFALKASNPQDAACQGLGAQQTATVSWASAKFNATGLSVDGSASDATVLLNSVNAKTPAAITLSQNSADFTADKVVNDGLKFSAKTKGGAQPGTFTTAASFAVAYK